MKNSIFSITILLLTILGAVSCTPPVDEAPPSPNYTNVIFQPDSNGDIQFSTNDPSLYNIGLIVGIPPFQPTLTTASITVEKKSGDPIGEMGMLFCMQDISNFYCVVVKVDGSYGIVKCVGGTFSLIRDLASTGNLVAGMGVKNTILVQYMGSHSFSLFFNGNHELDFTDDAFKGGYTGFYAYVGPSTYEDFPATPVDDRFRLLPAAPTTGGVVTTVAGTVGSQGYLEATGLNAKFFNPYGITTDGSNLFVSEVGNMTIRKTSISTGQVSFIAGQVTVRDSIDGTGSGAAFDVPMGMARVGGNLYVADNYNHTIRQVTIATGEVITFAGTPKTPGSGNDVGTAATFRYPMDITTDGTSLYVADTLNNCVRQIDLSTKLVSTLASVPYPYGIAFAGGNLYTAGGESHRIMKIALPAGTVTTAAGSGSSGSTDGVGTSASFYSPHGLTSDGTYLYIADFNNHLIRRMDLATNTVATVAGSAFVTGSADGNGVDARFNYPVGIVYAGGYLYVTDEANSTIRRIDPSPGPEVRAVAVAPKGQVVFNARVLGGMLTGHR